MSIQSESTPTLLNHNSTKHPGTRHRDALRLLFILAGGSVELEQPDKNGTTHVFQSEKRLMAIDFLIRYPDYLADALLDLYEEHKDKELINVVSTIFEKEEPSLRVIQMVRWHYGAYQKIETALATLAAYRLVLPMKLVKHGASKRYDYYLYPKAFSFLETAVVEVPDLQWYRDRVNLAMKVAEFKSGSKLKSLQYNHDEYSKTPYGGVIPTISDKVKSRLSIIRGAI